MSRRKGKTVDLKKMVETLLNSQNRPNQPARLTERDLLSLCDKSLQVFKDEPMLLEVSAPVKIVGDIHGQFPDLLRIFHLAGHPPKEKFLFLGDYVDRGRQGIECIALLFAYKVLYPDKVFLLRGNHECECISRVYGFYEENKRRFSERLWKQFVAVFNYMPISAYVENRILCMHGGISPDLHDLDQIRAIPRPADIPDYGLMCDILWADPSKDLPTGWGENERGISFTFAADVVTNFCRNMGIEMVCRAHQVVSEGYEFFGGRKLLTIFSAPNYCSESDNSAGILYVTKDLECGFMFLQPRSSLNKVKSSSSRK